MVERSLYPRMLAALLALLGLLDSAYLTLERFVPNLSMVCLTGGGCQTVQTSRWSTVPPGGGVPVAVIGLLGYGALLGLALAALQRDQLGSLSLPPTLALLAGGGVCVSLYLVFLQVFVIGAICSWCMLSAALELGILIAAVVDWRRWRFAKAVPLQANQPQALQIQ